MNSMDERLDRCSLHLRGQGVPRSDCIHNRLPFLLGSEDLPICTLKSENSLGALWPEVPREHEEEAVIARRGSLFCCSNWSCRKAFLSWRLCCLSALEARMNIAHRGGLRAHVKSPHSCGRGSVLRVGTYPIVNPLGPRESVCRFSQAGWHCYVYAER